MDTTGGGDSASRGSSGLTAEALYRLLFEESRDAIFFSSPDGQIVDINRAGLDLFAFDDKREILDADVGTLIYQDPSQRAELFECLEREGHVRDHELRLKTRDGRAVVVLETSSVVRGRGGESLAYVGVLRDITERRDLEDRLWRAQKMESLGRLAGGVAHDFRNIMMVIRGCGELAAGKISSESPAQEDLASISGAVERAVRITDQLLTISRRRPPAPAVLDLSLVVREMAKLLGRTIGGHISLKTHLEESTWSVLADRGSDGAGALEPGSQRPRCHAGRRTSGVDDRECHAR